MEKIISPEFRAYRFMQNRLCFWLSIKAIVVALIIAFMNIGLGPDEAQYWTWSQFLDVGYYSKPPGIAWQIWLGTQVFGQTEWGVRSIAVCMAFFQALFIYHLALKADLEPKAAFWCGLIMALSPLGIIGSLFSITDGGFLLCWTGACLTLLTALDRKTIPSPLKIGGWILLGALFKWPIYLFWFFFLCCRNWYFPAQKLKSVVQGIFLSLLGLFPSIWWNATHDWATFRHVAATLQGGSMAHQAGGNLPAFLGSQAILLSPLLFILLLLGLWKWFGQRQCLTPALFFCGFVTLTSMTGMMVWAYFQKVQGNWMTFAYPTGIIVLGWKAFEQRPQKMALVKVGIALSLCLTFGALFFFSSDYSRPLHRLNPLKHNLGWPALQSSLQAQGYDPRVNFLFSDKYQTASQLSFYGEGQKRAYFINLQGMRKNQFSYWPSLQAEQSGKTGFFVWVENAPHLQREWQSKLAFYQETLRHYFEEVHASELIPLLISEGESVAKGALIFRCACCKDDLPLDPQLY